MSCETSQQTTTFEDYVGNKDGSVQDSIQSIGGRGEIVLDGEDRQLELEFAILDWLSADVLLEDLLDEEEGGL